MAKRITDMAAASALTGDELIEVSQLSTTVKITAATISAQASDNSFNDSGNGLVAAGFATGDRVGVSGFTGNVANNIKVGIVTALTTGKMTIGGTDGDVIVDDAAGESVTIAKWTSRQTTADDIADLAAGGPSSVDYRVGFFFVATPTANEVLMRHVFTDAVTFADEFAGAYAKISTNPTATFVLAVQKNGAGVGTISISTSGVPTFATTGTTVAFAAGDEMEILGPATPDATAANCAVTLKGTT